jgi:hypothetical protein
LLGLLFIAGSSLIVGLLAVTLPTSRTEPPAQAKQQTQTNSATDPAQDSGPKPKWPPHFESPVVASADDEQQISQAVGLVVCGAKVKELQATQQEYEIPASTGSCFAITPTVTCSPTDTCCNPLNR